MSISDAEFSLWLKDGNRRRVLLSEVDFAYDSNASSPSAMTLAIGTIRLADYPYITEPADTPASVLYHDVVLAVPTFAQSIDTASLGGQTTYTIGQLQLSNADSHLDFMLALIVDGQECRFYLGDEDWARADFRNVATAIIQTINAPTEGIILIELRDRGLLVNSSIVGADVGGTGPNVGHPLPIVMGFAHNVEAILIDSLTLEYGVADTAATPVTVYDSGFELAVDNPLLAALGSTFTVDTGADTILHPSLFLATDDLLEITTGATMGLTSGDPYFVVYVDPTTFAFALSATRGGTPADLTASFIPGETVSVVRYPARDDVITPDTILLAHPPAGRVTCDVNVPILTNSRGSDFFYALAVTRGGLPSGKFTGPLESFTENNNACDFHLGLAIVDRRNTTDVLDDVAFSLNAFWGFDRLSNFIYGRIQPQALGSLTIAQEISSDDIVDIASLSLEHLLPTYKEIRGYFQKSWTAQTDGFAGGVPLDRVSYLQNGGLFYRTFESGTDDYTTRPATLHATMIDSPDLVTLISQEVCTDALAEFETWLAFRKAQLMPYLEVLKFKTNLRAYNRQLGDCVNVTLNRFGLDAGVRFQVIAIDVSLTDQTVALGLIRRHVPAATTSDYAEYGGA